jgi:hypothetical protein
MPFAVDPQIKLQALDKFRFLRLLKIDKIEALSLA